MRHRHTKEAATDMFYLTPPRHISTLPKAEVATFPGHVGCSPFRYGVCRPKSKSFSEIRQDRGVFGQRLPVVEDQRRHSALRIDLQVGLGALLCISKVGLLRLIFLAALLKHDMRCHRAGTRRKIQRQHPHPPLDYGLPHGVSNHGRPGSNRPNCPLWVKLRRAQYEHMFSALPSNSDVARRSRHVSNVAEADVLTQSKIT